MSVQDDSPGNEATKNSAGPEEAATARDVPAAQRTSETQGEAGHVQTIRSRALFGKAHSLPSDEVNGTTEVPEAAPSPFGTAKTGVKRAKRVNLAKQAASLRRVRLTSPASREEANTTAPDAIAASTPAGTSRSKLAWPQFAPLTRLSRKVGGERKIRKDHLQDWDHWSTFRLWRRTRPLWGSLLMFLSSLILLALAIYFLPFAFIVNSVWVSLFLGGLLLAMALIQLFLPSYAVITGSIGIVISLVSFITSTFGGLGIGMLLGIVGGTLSVSWRPVKRSRLVASSSSSTRA